MYSAFPPVQKPAKIHHCRTVMLEPVQRNRIFFQVTDITLNVGLQYVSNKQFQQFKLKYQSKASFKCCHWNV